MMKVVRLRNYDRFFGLVISIIVLVSVICCSKSELDNSDDEVPPGNSDILELAATTDSSPVVATEGGTIDVFFTASTSWTASAINDRADAWSSVSPKSGNAGSGKITITIKENSELEDRFISVVIKAGKVSKYINVTQKQKDAVILTSTKYEFTEEGGELCVEVKSNVSYDYEISEDAKGWIKYIRTKALSASKLIFSIEKNESIDSRSGMIIIGKGDLCDTVNVYQAGETPSIVLGAKECTIASKGGSFSVDVSSNVDVTTHIEYTDENGILKYDSEDWLQENKTRSMSTNTYNFNVAINEGLADRYARVVFANKENGLSDTIKVVQSNPFYIKSSVSNCNIDVEGGFIEISVEAGIEYDVIMPPVNWVVNATSDNHSDNYQFKVSINHSDSLRSAEIIFASSVYPISDTLKIYQSGNAQFFLLYDTIKLSYKETVFPLKINFKGVLSRVSSFVEGSCNWISKYDKTKGSDIYVTDPHWFKVDENMSNSSRYGKIIFKDWDRNLSDTIIIQQFPKTVQLIKNFSIRKKEFSVPMHAHKIPIIIEHDGPYYIDYDEQINSYNILERESFSDGCVDYYFVDVREADMPRSFNVYVWNETRSICDTIKVCQNESDEYIYAADFAGQQNFLSVVVPYNGADISYSLSTNLEDFVCVQKPSSDGLLLTQGSRVKTNVGYDEYFKTPVNNTDKSQFVTLYFLGENIAYISEVVIKPKLNICFDSPKELLLSHSGGQFSTNVWSNDKDLYIKIEGDNSGWLRMLNSEKDSRQDFSRIISTFEALPNFSGKHREAYIVAYNNFNQTERVRVFQPSGESILLSESLSYLGAWEQVLKVQLIDCDYKVSLDTGDGWVKIGQSEKIDGSIIQNLEISENDADVERRAKVVFISDTIVNEISLVQLPKSDALDDNSPEKWKNFTLPKVNFVSLYPGSLGAMIYSAIVKDPEFLIAVESRKVLDQLYFSPDEPLIPKRDEIEYKLDNYDGISAFYSGGNRSGIILSNQYIESYYRQYGVKKLVEENRGVLSHELTHSFQLSPRGVGDYSNPIFHACIEGMADAVRVLTGHFTDADRPKGGSYLDSYRYTGFFIAWLVKNKDKDFLRKFNMSTQYLDVWSFNGAIKYALGEQYDVDDLWAEYLRAMGDSNGTGDEDDADITI